MKCSKRRLRAEASHAWQEPKNIKALYRHAQGSMGSNDFDVALKDCKRILELDPNHKDETASRRARNC